jgi:hypothetical protein
MGIPAQTYFCENGHVVAHVPHNHMLGEDPETCNQCQSTNIRMVLDWNDPEYPGVDDVPITPIRFEHKIIEVDVPIYNVFRLFNSKRGVLKRDRGER